MERTSMWGRAALAVVLMVGFYALAAAVVVFCWGSAFLMVTAGGHIPVKLLLILVVAGGVVLWSVLPRWDRFEPPGPELTAEAHPALFRELGEIARKTGQPVPAEVYLVGDVNAFVANRGGVMGFGSRPVMGLGLPLLQSLSVPEMSAVIAHEFGHYVGGDTKIGPWIYKTRAAIVRSVENLASAQSIGVYPFLWYMRLFLRVTHAISRQQEFAADAVSARVTSAADAARALRKVHAIAPAYDAYWRTEVSPLLQEGHRPPVAEGFGRFLGEEKVASFVGEALRDVPVENADPYDTHPPLSQRLAALGESSAGPEGPPAPPALTLLGDVEGAEAALIDALLPPGHRVDALGWDQVGPTLYPRLWAKSLGEIPAVGAVTPLAVREALQAPAAFVQGALQGQALDAERAEVVTRFAVSGVLGRALLRAGWGVESLPGRPVTLRRGDEAHTLDELAQLAKDATADEWRARLVALGLGEADLERRNGDA